MATIIKNGLFEAIRKRGYGDVDYLHWEGWILEGQPSTETTYERTENAIAYMVKVQESYPITAASLNVAIRTLWSDITSYTITAGIYQADPTTGGTALRTQTFTAGSNETHEFSFSSLGIEETLPYHELYFLLDITDCQSSEDHLINNDPPLSFKANAALFSLTAPALSVGVTPSALYAGDRITADFTNRIGETLTVRVFYNTTLLDETTAASDSIVISCPESWFDVAGVTGNSMGLKLRASDGNGRTSNDAAFTLRRATGGTISPVAPRSTTLDGTASINFAWNYSGDGTLTKTELQWSRDNAAWTDLATVSGNGTSWTAAPISFPAGTIYWRARATNSFGLVGAWSSGVSFTVKYAAQSQAVPVNTPTGGTIIAAQAQTFQIALEASAPVYEPFTVSAATFYWRAGESGEYTAVTMTPSGNSASVTIPAGTFPSGGIQWYASATDNTGRTTQTSVFSLSTLNSAVEAIPISPINTVENGDQPIWVSFKFLSAAQEHLRGGTFKVSQDNENWTEHEFSRTGEDDFPPNLPTLLFIPADFFSAGTVWWQIRVQTVSGIWSPYSEIVSFRVFGAPKISAVTGDGKPFLTVNWQVEGQIAYKIEVDGKTYGPYRGDSTRSFTLPEPLPDGLHVVKVAAQNQFTLWSAWAEANVSVTNVPGPEITIDAEWPQDENIRIVYTDAIIAPEIIKTLPETVRIDMGRWTLSVVEYFSEANVFQWYFRANESQAWTAIDGATGRSYTIEGATRNNGQYRVKVSNPVGEVYSNISNFTYDAFASSYVSDIFDTDLYAETGQFLIYRDGALIGTTKRNNFYDRAALGAHEYYVIQVLPGGYYTKSNVVTLTGSVDCPAIALLSGGDFLMLELSEDANRTQTITKGGEVAYIQYSGSKYPEAEIGEAESLTVTGDVSFTAEQEADARRFESMLKKAVIYKTPGNEVVVGILQGFTRRDPRFFKSYSFSVTQMERRDFVNA